MGSRILAMVVDDSEARLVGATEAPGNAKVGLDAGFAAGRGSLEVPIRDDLGAVLEEGAAQVVIDFTSAEASARHARICADHGVALVVGSTGFDDAAEEEVRAASERIPIVKAPNMSVSVNLLFLLARRAAEVLGSEYQVEITEIHHAMKKDSPSGTALRLGEMVAEGLGRDLRQVAVYGRHGNVGERSNEEIGIHAVRGGDVVGEHTVYFFGEGDRIELTHRATSRDSFARGAVRAAKWVVGRPPGLYGMVDVLGFA
ncbi:MAG: 4-hydroxy-tetrahydrodipicolinate reductase [Deltaproteobacteria bacterium]|nr:MAG: 4-hydroxy-tetrahydrodipicolinate reductase [Deltaproteobacteria bacterium]